MKNTTGGRGTNLTDADRKKGGEHSHSSQGPSKGGRSNLTDADRKKGGEHSHKK